MSTRTGPPFRADHVGSLLRPQRLLAERYSGVTQAGLLRALEDECIREVVALQEAIGLDVVTDGEFRRESWRSGFTGCVEGLIQRNAQAEVNRRGYVDMGSFIMDAAPFVEGKLKRRRGIVAEEFRFLSAVTSRTPKVALPAPSFMHFFGGPDAVDRSVYPDLDTFHADLVAIYAEEIAYLAALGATYIQLDDAPLGFLCDAGVRARLASAGIAANDWVDLYLDMLNAVVSAAPPATTVAVHICRGNSMGQSGGTGSFESVAARAFHKLNAPLLLLEFDEPHHGDLSPLRFVPDDKTVVLGLISTKTAVLEEPGWLKSRIRAATRYIPMERLCVSPQCGFASRDRGTTLTLDDQMAKLSLLVQVARDMWP
jgi:5-methyltetrahydropteroyltriglutamate--homocysteine methyltransferase